MKTFVSLAVAAALAGGCAPVPKQCAGPEMTREEALQAAIDRLQAETGTSYLIGATPQVADEPIDISSCCTVSRREDPDRGGEIWHVTTQAKTRDGYVLAFTDFDLCGRQIDDGEIIDADAVATGS